MNTRREQILSALKTKLDGVTLATGGVYRSRVYALTRAQTPAIILDPVSDNCDTSMLGVIDWSMLIRIAVVVRGNLASDISADQVADPIVNAIHPLVISDKRLGGLTMDIEPVSATFEIQGGDQPIGVVSLAYSVKYRTVDTDLSI